MSHDFPRFTFEETGAQGRPGFDAYFSPRLLARGAWFFVRRWLNIDRSLQPGEEFDRRIARVHEQQWAGARSADRLVMLAFDEYRNDAGEVTGPVEKGVRFGTDLYVSNSFVRAMCAAEPQKFLFGASIHPYRPDACAMLEEVASAGAVLVKWLPIHQNIRAEDPRTVSFLRTAARLGMPMLIHYGGEMSLSRQHMEFESPVPMLNALRDLRHEKRMPTVIVAHVATPSFIWQSSSGHRALVDAMLGEFRADPLYADISALAAFGRTPWLKRLAKQRELHCKLLWGSDYPIPVMLVSFWRQVSRAERQRIAALESWIEQDLALKRALGYGDEVFTHAAKILRVG